MTVCQSGMAVRIEDFQSLEELFLDIRPVLQL